jgi:hypothetical protein
MATPILSLGQLSDPALEALEAPLRAPTIHDSTQVTLNDCASAIEDSRRRKRKAYFAGVTSNEEMEAKVRKTAILLAGSLLQMSDDL